MPITKEDEIANVLRRYVEEYGAYMPWCEADYIALAQEVLQAANLAEQSKKETKNGDNT